MDATRTAETMRDAALELAALGFAVFPIKERSKEPRTDAALGFIHGVKDATCDPDRIAAAWTKYPADNIGIACGAPSGNLIVIDIDNHNAEHNGFDTLTAWEAENGHMPETATATTGTGGMHLFYYMQSEISTVHACAACGIDVQAAGCYVVAAPSIHPNGTHYAWILPPDVIPVAQADKRMMQFIEHMRQQMRPTEPAECAQSPLRGAQGGRYRQNYADTYIKPTQIREGNRNIELFKYAAHLWAQGYSITEIMALADTFNSRVCDPPLPTNEVTRIVRSVVERYPQGHSASWDAAHPAPQRRTPARPNIAAKLAHRLERREKR